MQQKSWWQEVTNTFKVAKDERTKHIRALAGRNGYFTLSSMALLTGVHDWVTTGDAMGIWVILTLIAISVFFLGFTNAHILTAKTFDERASQLILRNFLWAFYLMSVGVLCYLTYVTYLAISGNGSRSNQTWAIIFQVVLVVMTATYVVKELEHNGQWSLLFWLTASVNMFVAAFNVIFGLIEVVKDSSLSKLMALMVNPNLTSLIIVSFASLVVFRYYDKQEAHSNE